MTRTSLPYGVVVKIKSYNVCRVSRDRRGAVKPIMWEDRSHCRQGNREDSQGVWFPSGSNQVARPKDGLESFPWQIWKRFVLPSSRPHAASDRRAGITGGHSWQPIHFADSSIRGAAPSQSLASRLKAESCKAAGTWRYAGKLLPCEGQPWFVICFPF